MTRSIEIQARWDDDEGVWLATSDDVPGLAIEADTWSLMIEELKMNVPELLGRSAATSGGLSLTVTAQEHIDLS